jgi:hypothetical protein
MDFAFGALLFGEAQEAGWSWALALRLFSDLRRGWPCSRGHCFIPERGKGVLAGSRWLTLELVSAADPSTVASVFFDDAGVVFVGCPVRGQLPAWLVQEKIHWLQEYVQLALDDGGMLIYPTLTVTALVERLHVWERLIMMDGVTRAIVSGKLCYQRTCWLITPSYLPPPQELGGGGCEGEARLEGGSGAIEFVHPWQPLPTIIEPKGSVPKNGPDGFRDIAGVRRVFDGETRTLSRRWRWEQTAPSN